VDLRDHIGGFLHLRRDSDISINVSAFRLPARIDSLPCSSRRENAIQPIELQQLLAGLQLRPPCILSKSPCNSQNCRERQVRDRLRPPPRSPPRLQSPRPDKKSPLTGARLTRDFQYTVSGSSHWSNLGLGLRPKKSWSWRGLRQTALTKTIRAARIAVPIPLANPARW
jgi:hypothetical protein